MATMTLMKALTQHCKLPAEALPAWAKQTRELSNEDRQWFAGRFAAEFGYEIDPASINRVEKSTSAAT